MLLYDSLDFLDIIVNVNDPDYVLHNMIFADYLQETYYWEAIPCIIRHYFLGDKYYVIRKDEYLTTTRNINIPPVFINLGYIEGFLTLQYNANTKYYCLRFNFGYFTNNSAYSWLDVVILNHDLIDSLLLELGHNGVIRQMIDRIKEGRT